MIGDCKLMIVSTTTNIDKNTDDKKFTIQYTKEELDKIQNEFLEQINKYIAIMVRGSIHLSGRYFANCEELSLIVKLISESLLLLLLLEIKVIILLLLLW